ncbi:hypothetical protein [Actinomadura rudentiformis]|uniref:Uncharacterized protein n=1 Tax=Actinomadura rudentiformis TaxID=359158 RepID=A0A6H9YK03_9ACTN|nr:hypothetical protein [Actinomadura rudentiformis]KAB2344733.1 hypothetical protein F8566_29430 [Actinomadura rudentiformis]
MMSIRRKPQDEVLSRFGRVREACRHGAETWRLNASDAADRIAPAAQRTRDVAADRIMGARGWSAPRIENAARYVEGGLAPRVSSFLSDVADRVEPPKPSHRGRNITMMMLAAVAAVGIAGAVMTKRNSMQSLMEDDMSQPEAPAKSEANSHAHTP